MPTLREFTGSPTLSEAMTHWGTDIETDYYKKYIIGIDPATDSLIQKLDKKEKVKNKKLLLLCH